MSIRRGSFDRRARLTHRVLSAAPLSCTVILMRFTFGVIFRFFFSMSTTWFSEVSFQPLQGCLRPHGWFFDHGVKSPRHAAGGGHDVRCLHGVVADCSRHSWDWSSWLGLRRRRRRRKPHILTYPVTFDQSAKQYVVFRLASLADVCEAQSRIDSEWSTGRRG